MNRLETLSSRARTLGESWISMMEMLERYHVQKTLEEIAMQDAVKGIITEIADICAENTKNN
jgi:hypothetical protein